MGETACKRTGAKLAQISTRRSKQRQKNDILALLVDCGGEKNT